MIYFQNEATAARRRVWLYLVDAADGLTPETGEAAGQPQISKNGAAWANTTATLVAVGNGTYYVELTATELDTLGKLLIRFKSTNTAEFSMVADVVAYNAYDVVRMGLTALPNAAAQAAGGLYTRGTGAGQINQPADGQIDTRTAAMLANVLTAAAMAADARDGITDSVWQETLDTYESTVAGGRIMSILLNSNDLVTRLTSARAAYLDKLNISGNVAGSSEVTSIQNNTRVVRVVPDVIERPDAGTVTYRVELLLYDDVGNMEAPDSAPTIELVNQAGVDRSARLDSVIMALVETGRYRAVYTAAVADTLEQLIWSFSVVEGGVTRKYGNASLIVDTSAVDFTAADRAKLDTLHDTRLTAGRAANLDFLTGDAFVRLGAPAGASIAADIAARASQVSLDAAAVSIGTILAAVDTEIAAIKAKTDQLGFTNANKVDASLQAAADVVQAVRDALANALLDLANGVEAGLTVREHMRTMEAASAGITNGAGTATFNARDKANTKNRIQASTDASGNRTAVILDPS